MAFAVQLPTGAGDLQVYSGAGRLAGWSIRESAAAALPATVILRDGDDATDPILAVIELGADGSANFSFGDDTVEFRTGVFVDRAAGETMGVIYIGTR